MSTDRSRGSISARLELHHLERKPLSLRSPSTADLPSLKEIIAANDLFPADMLPTMMADFLAGKSGSGLWLAAYDQTAVGIVHCVPEPMTRGTSNMLLLAVHPLWQGRGCGTALVRAVEQALALEGMRILLVETSGRAQFAGARSFYEKLGFQNEARIRDFYEPGDDKVIFRKLLQ